MSAKVETAMVLAAGYGIRMRPLTETTPKPLVALRDLPLIDHVLDGLLDAGVSKAVVNVHYLADQIEAHVETRLAAGEEPEIAISDERAELLDTGGGTKHALSLLGSGPFFVHNSDAVWQEDQGMALSRMAAMWDPETMDALLLLADKETSLGYSGAGDFSLGEDGRLARRGEDAAAPFIFAGVSICDARLFEGAPEGPFSLNLLWDRALEKGRLMGVTLGGRWMHIGTPEALAEAEALLDAADG
ncbi:nucleotidyltransferase family protein [Methyloligella sp. 2.7D]|uniref:nucleotidyltransferase family protein n=1 Tax=unclassified Methyloligella TaxID=2625955 RepID=UPI00157CEEE5|nr:nucleotidyltransferase family protein [Methyloligella sp. GL2]QKP76056.1 nucleotidyltransferase family protein [Methyloligella sp. GL2]